jgi:hypothetical protein
MAMHLYTLTKCIVMKKMILCSVLCLSLAVYASAQTTSRSRNSSGRQVSTSSHTAKRTTYKKEGGETSIATIPMRIPVDNRKEYMQDGQLATATGHQATPINSDEYQSPRDSSLRKRKKQ